MNLGVFVVLAVFLLAACTSQTPEKVQETVAEVPPPFPESIAEPSAQAANAEARPCNSEEECMVDCLKLFSEAECRELADQHKKEAPQQQPQQQERKPGFLRFGQQLPECSGQELTVAPVELNKLRGITPLGNLNPPEHTIPTQHMYLELNSDFGTLKAPGDVQLLSIRTTKYLSTGREDYGINFALCEDVQGYFLHIQSLSPKLKALIKESDCKSTGDLESGGNYEYCNTDLSDYTLKAGEEIGSVGRIFDLGMQDFRTMQDAANPERYGSQMLSVVCPLGYFDSATQAGLYSKISRTQEPRCGRMIQDIKGTLQGNWFYGDAKFESPAAWNKHLAFASDNNDPSKSVISVGGVFMDASRNEVVPRASGTMDRKFSDVSADGKIYCYNAQPGRIALRMVSETELEIERQNGDCAGNLMLNKPFKYER